MRRKPISRRQRRKVNLKDKWVKRSDIVIVSMIRLWFLGAFWGFGVVTIQAFCSDYPPDVSSVLTYIGAPVTGGIVTWLIKSLGENMTKTKLNPDYLKTHLPSDDIE